MTIQTVNLGTAPTGAGGDTFRSTGAKMNENFTNNTHAASRYVGTAAGNVMEVGAFGLGSGIVGGMEMSRIGVYGPADVLANIKSDKQGADKSHYFVKNGAMPAVAPENYGSIFGFICSDNNYLYSWQMFSGYSLETMYWRRATGAGTWSPWSRLWNDRITTVDSNGFIKAASPIVKLFADKIELNDEAAEQNITFEKVGIGHYLVKGSSGFAKEGWWIEIPTDTHGNKICAVEYQTLENGDIEIKTFKKKLNDEGDIVANLDAPIDIPNNANGEPRWIDIRLNEIKKPVVIKTARTEKQPRMVQQVKYAPQLTYITKYEDLFDDEGKAVIVDGKNYKKPVTHIQTDQNGTPILTNQPVINENGEPVFEWVQAVDSEGNPVFDDVPVLDKDGNPIYDEVTYDPE
ncbi:pyocin knob domain-containing protein [Acinetobacter seifertii]|uniref:pyocin knob domain-containing protein n=1 Tax=Acinetobacter seifertii TaxID=1530123 RepID=UPI00280C8B83|nr:pyocin knob domain-containing protein [Acinetobacter seifertii]MDQ9037783.1 pyocin knob domain-containing protein [Acinetobacter seifertii]